MPRTKRHPRLPPPLTTGRVRGRARTPHSKGWQRRQCPPQPSKGRVRVRLTAARVRPVPARTGGGAGRTLPRAPVTLVARALALQGLILTALTALYATILNTSLTLVDCVPTTMTVADYLQLSVDGTTCARRCASNTHWMCCAPAKISRIRTAARQWCRCSQRTSPCCCCPRTRFPCATRRSTGPRASSAWVAIAAFCVGFPAAFHALLRATGMNARLPGGRGGKRWRGRRVASRRSAQCSCGRRARAPRAAAGGSCLACCGSRFVYRRFMRGLMTARLRAAVALRARTLARLDARDDLLLDGEGAGAGGAAAAQRGTAAPRPCVAARRRGCHLTGSHSRTPGAGVRAAVRAPAVVAAAPVLRAPQRRRRLCSCRWSQPTAAAAAASPPARASRRCRIW